MHPWGFGMWGTNLSIKWRWLAWRELPWGSSSKLWVWNKNFCPKKSYVTSYKYWVCCSFIYSLHEREEFEYRSVYFDTANLCDWSTFEIMVNGRNITFTYKQDILDSDDWDTQRVLEFLTLLDAVWSWYMCWDSLIVTAYTSFTHASVKVGI